MDPLTHIVIGRAVVAAARDERRNRAVGAAAILGALAPDVDSAVAFAGWDRYVRAHQFGTHSLAGALVMALLTAIVVDRAARVVSRNRPRLPVAQASRPAHGREGSPEGLRYGDLCAAAGAGALSHIVLDLMSGARIAVLWPLVDRRVSMPLVAMADPWVIAICIVWLLMLWPARVSLRRASRAVVAAAAIFLCMKAALLGLALRDAAIAPREPSAVEARWGSLTEWFVFERLADAVRSSAIAANAGPRVLITEPIAPESPFVRASRALEDVRNFVAVHEFTFADETRDGDGRVSVLWSDLRYCWPAAQGRVWRPATNCGVRVGGVFDANGHPIVQEIRVGAIVQRR
jgi:membrane-bound metal-dependent hydrolase YbcI (DUF457 family)